MISENEDKLLKSFTPAVLVTNCKWKNKGKQRQMDDKDGYRNFFGRRRKIARSTLPPVLIRDSITESSREDHQN
ncbi:hypothetical protein LIER_32163 [Lithospermum erythrorhizon]|uniref:Uncharacterized protein n=1 Tax=Lithospermum erythrorhizon TaxID=34254 RepID=A0AAV3RW81_LITER